MIKAAVTTLAITAIWYALEYQQYGALQWDRQCDNVVGTMFFLALWYAFENGG